jgi:dienelactone hydrolase
MNEAEQKPSGSIRHRVVLAALIVAVPLLIAAVPFLLGFGFISALTRQTCGADISPQLYGLAAEEVTFASSEFTQAYPAYFIPAATDRTVIVVPTLGAGRGDLMAAIRLYHEHGFHVLTYRSRVCFGVPHSLGYAEVSAIGDAYTYLLSRPDVNPSQIALHGFSAGGAAVLMALERYPQIRTAVAHGGYEDFERLLSAEARGLGELGGFFEAGARAAYTLATGYPLSVLKPIDAVRRSAPRPILLVYGSTEVSLEAARAMQAAAPDRVQLWVVLGAGHGDYIETAGAARYAEVVVGFLDAALSAPAPAP